MFTRRKSKQINIGGVAIGGDAPISVQSMTNTDTRNASATITQIKECETLGCELIRVAVPDEAAAANLGKIKNAINIPLIADIHFDYRLALKAIEEGVDGLRLNPGNIGQDWKVREVVNAAKERSVPIRIGVNAGSLLKDSDASLSTSKRMINAAMKQIDLLESMDYNLIKVSLKAFDVPTTVEAYCDIAKRIPYPLHIGITEAGTPKTGMIRSAVGIGSLLYMGIGDTIRVSLTGKPQDEVICAYEILKSLNLRKRGVTLVSCPTCGRTETDIISLALKVEKALEGIDKPVKVAVMGCAVNGPGEAKDADIGIACGKGKGILFKRGEKVGTVKEIDYLSVLVREVESF